MGVEGPINVEFVSVGGGGCQESIEALWGEMFLVRNEVTCHSCSACVACLRTEVGCHGWFQKMMLLQAFHIYHHIQPISS